MKRGRGGDSTEALRKIWMEGYREGKKAGALAEWWRKRHAKTDIPVVEIDSADLRAVYEPGHCAHPGKCPCGSAPGAGGGVR